MGILRAGDVPALPVSAPQLAANRKTPGRQRPHVVL